MSISRWVRVSGLALVIAVLATACASDDAEPDGVDVAASVIATVEAARGTAAPPTTLAEGCRIVQKQDEYGFPIDVEVCDGATTTMPSPDADLAFADWAGGKEAEALAALVRDALVIHGGCADDETLRDLEVAISGAPDEVRAPLEVAAAELARASTVCASDVDAWAAHMRSAIVAMEEFVRVADAARTDGRDGADDE